MKRIALILLCALTLCAPAWATEPLHRHDFARMMPLTLSGSGALYELPLPAEVYAWAERCDLGDLAVFNNADEIVPFTLVQPAPAQTVVAGRELPLFPLTAAVHQQPGGIAMQVRTDEHGAIVNLATAPGAATQTPVTDYIVDASTLEMPIHGFDIALAPNGKDYIGTLRVETSDDLHQWRQHATGALATLSAGAWRLTRNRVEFPGIKARYFRLSIGPGQDAPRIGSVSARLESSPATGRRETASFIITPVKGRSGEYLARTNGYLPIDRLRLAFPDDNSLAGVAFLSRPDDKSPWTERGSGIFYRLQRDGTVAESGALEIPPTPDREWLIRVRQPGSGLGGRLPRLEVGWQPHRLIFAARGQGPFYLAYGSARTGPDCLRDDSIATSLATWEKQRITPLPAQAGPSVESGGREALRPRIPAATWRKVLLWGVLLLGVALMGSMAWRLAREMGLTDARKNPSKND